MNHDPSATDSSPARRRVLAIGNHPDTASPGGVVTHMRFLRNLGCLQPLDVFDVGSLHGAAALGSRWAILSILSNLVKLRSLVRFGSYSLIMVNQPITGPALIKLALVILALPKQARSRVLAFYHGGRFERLRLARFAAARWLLERMFRQCNSHYFLSAAEESGFNRYFAGLRSQRFRNFSESTDTLPSERSSNGHLKLLFVGRVARVKGVFDLVEVMKRLPDYVSLDLVGSGPDLEAVKALVSESGLDRRVTFPGFLRGDQLEIRYRQADALVLPTFHPEGLPYVMIEAMRAGLPVICSPEGALEDYVVDGTNGYLVEAGDIEQLRTAIVQLTDRDLRKYLSGNCYSTFVEYFSRQQATNFYSVLRRDNVSTVG